MKATITTFGKWTLALVCASVWGISTGRADTGYANYARHRELLREATKLENMGKYTKAARLYGKSALYAKDTKAKATVLVRKGDCFFNAGKPYDALDAYRTLLENYPLYVPYDHVVAQLRELAGRFVRGDGTFLGLRDRDTAIEIYQLILQEMPSMKGWIQDSKRLAGLLTEKDRYAEAIDVYRDLLKKGVSGKDAADVHIELGRLLMDLSRTADGDGSISRQAKEQLDIFLSRYPDDPRREEATFMRKLVDERRAERLYKLGEFYTREPHRALPAARRYLSDAVHEYGETTAGQMAKILLENFPKEPPKVTARPAAATPVAALPQTGAPTAAKPAAAEAEKRRHETAAVKPKHFQSLEKRENVKKYLRPVGDVNELDKGEKAK